MNTLYRSSVAWTTDVVTFCAQNGVPCSPDRGGGERFPHHQSAATFLWSYARENGQGATLNTRLPITSYKKNVKFFSM